MVKYAKPDYQFETSLDGESSKKEHKKLEKGCYPILNANDNQEPRPIRVLIGRKAKKTHQDKL